MSKQLTDEEVDAFEEKCRKAEALLEEIGRDVCPAENGSECWNAVNSAVCRVQEAIHSAWRMRPERND